MSGDSEKSLYKKTISGGKWSALRKISSRAVGFVVTIILARLLTPEDFGLVAMLTIFVELGITISESGLTSALIRTVNISDEDYSTAFVYNIVVSIAIYAVIWVCAPFIADFFEAPELKTLARIVSLNIPLRSLCSLKLCTLEAAMNFKLPAIAEFSSNIISGLIGVSFALAGAGVMSLAYYQVGNAAVLGLILYFSTERRHIGKFSRRSFRKLFGFGNRLLSAGILHVIYNNMYLFTIGKFYNAIDLGYFTRARQFASVPPIGIAESIKGVTYSALCRFKDDADALKSRGLRIIRLVAFITFPIVAFIFFYSVPLVEVLVGNQWRDSEELLMILSIGMMCYPIDVVNLQIIQAAGRSDYYLHAEIWKKAVGVISLLAALPFGIYYLTIAFTAASLISVMIDMIYTAKCNGPSLWREIREMSPIFGIALLSGVVSAVASYAVTQEFWLMLIIGMIILGGIYFLLSKLFKLKEVEEIKRIFSKEISNKQ